MRKRERTLVDIEQAPEQAPNPQTVVEALLVALPGTGIRLYRAKGERGHVDVVLWDGQELTTYPKVLVPDPVQPMLPVYLLTAWNPLGRPTSLRRNQRAQQQLHARLDESGWSWAGAVVHEKGLGWAEPAAAVHDGPDASLARHEVLELARRFGQLAVIRLEESGLSVLDTADGAVLLEPTPIRCVEKVFSGCPMQDSWPGGDVLCRDIGGPYGSRAIRASGYWHYERRSLMSLVGCELCHGGPIAGPFPNGGGSLLGEVSVTNRIHDMLEIAYPDPQIAAELRLTEANGDVAPH
jgi:hypothetical protein